MNESFLYTEIEDLQNEIAAIHTGSVRGSDKVKESSYSLFDSSSILTKPPFEPHHQVKDVFDRLSRPKLRYTSEVDSQPSITTEVMDELTFAPNTLKSKASYKTLYIQSKNETGCSNAKIAEEVDVVSRLMNAGKESEHNLRNKRLEQSIKETENCSFQPSLCKTSRKIISKKPYVPLTNLTRQEMIRNKKFNETEKLRRDQEKAMETTFKPIKFGGQKNFLINDDYIPIHERVVTHERRKQAKQNWLSRDGSDANFQPVINDRSRRIATELFDYENIHHKLFAIHELTEKKKEIKRKEHVPNFQPRINSLSKVLAKTKSTTTKLQTEKRIDAECTFQPKINPLSRLLAEENRKRKQDQNEVEENVKSNPKKEDVVYSFKPKINVNIKVEDTKHYINLANPKLLSQRIFLQQNRKEKKLEKLKNHLVKERSKEETFKPVTNQLKKENCIPVVVKGLSRFLARQDRAKQNAKEQQEYEDKIFYRKKAYHYKPRTLTTPKPFLLNRKKPKKLYYLEQ